MIGFLRIFKKELNPSKRKITVQVSGEDLYAEKYNDEVDSIWAPFVIEKIRDLKVFLRLDQDDQKSCETLIHISPSSTLVSTSDIGTDWGAAIQADLNKHLKSRKIVARFIWARLNGLLKMLMYPFLILGSVYYILWHFEQNTAFLISMFGFLLAGLLLLSREIHQYFAPPKPFQAVTEEKLGKQISFQLIVTIMSLLTALIGIAKELISLFK